ncbi:MAG: glycosyltransferase [Anaerolineales bacterium]|nr:glycosyltransferase [Anaerolineales bacterium]
MIILINFIRALFEVLVFPFLLLTTFLGRFSNKPIDIGLGPEPFVSHAYHKKALESYGYSAQTYVDSVYFITNQFDVRADNWIKAKSLRKLLLPFIEFVWSVHRYKCVYIYFNGGPLGLGTVLLWRIEPFLYRIAKSKVIVMPYGGDVQEITRSANLLFKDAMTRDYPKQRLRRKRIGTQIDLWTRHADHIIGGCEWVDYMYHWDTLMLLHFPIDVDRWKQPELLDKNQVSTIRILHAPNHRAMKGTRFFIQAVDDLRAEGFNLELILAERVSNDQIHDLMASVDIIADQLIIGWYAMFALEGMAMGKPVLCYLRSDLEDLYITTGLVRPTEIPIVKCSPLTIKDVLRDLISNRERIREIGERSRKFILQHHSLKVIGSVLDEINRSVGIIPSGQREDN